MNFTIFQDSCIYTDWEPIFHTVAHISLRAYKLNCMQSCSGERSIQYSAPKLYNKLPKEIKDSENITQLKKKN